ncbi:MAG: tail protein X [Pseudomonadota bacterium]
MTVAARQAEPLDELVWRSIGGGAAAVEAVLAANRGLAGLGPALPEGTLVIIPDTNPAPEPLPLVQLWD